LLQQTKDSSNLIGRERKFVHWAFTLKVNSQWTKPSRNAYMATLLVRLSAKSLSCGRKFVQDKNGTPNCLQEDKLLFCKFIQTP
jgi:hypothetical protein